VSSKPVTVLKFGGTSMADPEHVRQVARIVLDKKSAGHRVVAVVSARARQTDSFIEEARSLASHPQSQFGAISETKEAKPPLILNWRLLCDEGDFNIML
jgi:aspartokinase